MSSQHLADPSAWAKDVEIEMNIAALRAGISAQQPTYAGIQAGIDTHPMMAMFAEAMRSADLDGGPAPLTVTGLNAHSTADQSEDTAHRKAVLVTTTDTRNVTVLPSDRRMVGAAELDRVITDLSKALKDPQNTTASLRTDLHSLNDLQVRFKQLCQDIDDDPERTTPEAFTFGWEGGSGLTAKRVMMVAKRKKGI